MSPLLETLKHLKAEGDIVVPYKSPIKDAVEALLKRAESIEDTIDLCIEHKPAEGIIDDTPKFYNGGPAGPGCDVCCDETGCWNCREET